MPVPRERALVDDEMVQAIERFLFMLREGPLRVVAPVSAKPLCLFTDAAYEGTAGSQRCGLGGVLFDHDGTACFFFWQKKIASRPVVCYVDNNGTRDVLIKGAAG